jgi:RNAse (barnase) inhibitor barstar
MSKEFEIGINLIRRVQKELEELLEVEDRLSARKIANAIINPITASAYQIRVGEGPNKEELLNTLIPLVKEMRELSDIDKLKEHVKNLISLLKEVEEAVSEKKEG